MALFAPSGRAPIMGVAPDPASSLPQIGFGLIPKAAQVGEKSQRKRRIRKIFLIEIKAFKT
jgi:hypothetical protein